MRFRVQLYDMWNINDIKRYPSFSSYGLAWMSFLCTESRSHLFSFICLQSPQNFGRYMKIQRLLWWSLWFYKIYISNHIVCIYIYTSMSIYKSINLTLWYALLLASIGPNVSERCANLDAATTQSANSNMLLQLLLQTVCWDIKYLTHLSCVVMATNSAQWCPSFPQKHANQILSQRLQNQWPRELMKLFRVL